MATQRQGGGAVAAIGIIGGIIALVASFFLAGEGDIPGEFFITRQAMWGDGKYYVKLTFLLTLFTVFDVVGVPLIIFAGLRAMFTAKPPAIEPPPTWDLSQTGRKVKQFGLVIGLSVFWVAFTGVSLFRPQLLNPVGFFAILFLLTIPILPMFIPAVLFDAVTPIQYFEGNVESVHVTRNRNNVTAHLTIAGKDLQTTPEKIAGITNGMRVGALVSGFFNSVLRLERRA
ncbi:MAG: hypothetical protein QM817_27315 [Archangium sp.]